ncbi:MAG: FG-GAP-like repeat-containing protein [Planctomycetota bacterium]
MAQSDRYAKFVRVCLASTCAALAWGCGWALASPPAFTNQTAGSGLASTHQATYSHGFPAGGTVGDFNRDGWQDVFHAVGGGQPDRLFMNNGDGTFTNRATEWGIAANVQSTGGAVGDFDRDGWPDLFVSAYGQNRLYRNMGGTAFVNVAVAAGVAASAPFGGAFGDYDLDGDLDLAVVSWDSAPANRLYRNNGDGTFADVTATSGVGAAVSGITGFTVRFCDMNDDLYPEILWVGDFGTTRFLRNNGNGTFTNIAAAAGVAFDGTEMGHAVADFDRDGDFDWYVTTINTNNLYRNNGNFQFTQIAEAAGVAFTGWGWGAVAVDFNHDARVDLAATSQGSGQYLFTNNTNFPGGALQFTSANAGFQSGVSGRGLANFDYDNDGDQDLLVFPHTGALQLFRNDLVSADDTHWVRIFLDTAQDADLAPHGVGAVLWVTAGGITQLGRLDAGSNYQSQSELAVHFGLGTATVIDSITVVWPNGEVTTLVNVPADQVLTIASTPVLPVTLVRGDANDDGSVNLADAIRLLDYVFGGQLVDCVQSLDSNGDLSVNVADVVFLLGHLFSGAGPLPQPFPDCGSPDPAGPACTAFASCP